MGSLITLLANAVTGFFDIISSMFSGAANLVGDVFGAIVGFVALIGNSILAIFTGAINLVVDVLKFPFQLLK